jgi:hypothetical protein
MKVGVQNNYLFRLPSSFSPSPADSDSYRLNNGTPNQITESILPLPNETNIHEFALYAQDTWTRKKLTLSGALRYDYEASSYPDQRLPASRFLPNGLSLAAADGASFKDITPRFSAAYDLFGNGKTAIKAAIGRYVIAQDGGSSIFVGPLNPVSRLATSVTRTWTDQNKDFIPNCDLLNPNQQDLRATGGDFCGVISNLAFGTGATGITTRYDPAILSGWGVRPYNWEMSVGIQHELLSHLAINVTYGRRWYGNFTVTDNLATTAADYTVYNLPVPVDPRLPNSGGTVTFFDVNPVSTTGASLVSKVDNLVTAASKYGNQKQHWNGFDLTMSTRFKSFLIQGGMNAGRTSTDTCEIVAKVPESTASGTTPLNFCSTSIFLTQARFLGSYTVPKIDVLISGTLQALPGAQLNANWAASSTANIQPVLHRPVTGGAPNVTVGLVEPGAMFGDRINQLDFRIGKLLKFGRTRSQISLDLYNALNSSPVQTYNQAFIPGGAWLTPTLILPARLAKISAQFDF